MSYPTRRRSISAIGAGFRGCDPVTKPRAPLTYDNAISRIAGEIGWEAMAAAVGQKERTVRDWGDPDVERGCPIEAAELLDLAYQAAGGAGAPMHDTMSLRLEQERGRRFADQVAIAHGTCVMSREVAQAIEALILLQLPGATEQQRITAIRELEEAIASARDLLPLVSALPAGLIPDTS